MHEEYPNVDETAANAIWENFKGMIVDYVVFEQDLLYFDASNSPPEDKKHLKYSALTPESVMILKWLNQYCSQKNIAIEQFLQNYSYDQVVQTWTKKSDVKIIKFDTFFYLLK